jgi:hypothetical protein
VGGTILFSGLNCGAAPGDRTPAAAGAEIVLVKAYLVFTKESWGCLGGQTVVAEVTDHLAGTERQAVSLTEVKNPEDVNNRLELFLYFSAIDIGGVPGYFILRLGVEGSKATIPGVLQIADAVVVQSEEKNWSFLLKCETKGHLKSDLIYAGDLQLHSGIFTCAPGRKARPVDFLQVYPIRSGLSSKATEIGAQWSRVTIPLDDFCLEDAKEVAACYSLLTEMEKRLSISTEQRFLWDQSRLNSQMLNRLSSFFDQDRNIRFHVNVELRTPQGTLEIESDSTPFLPQLRQMISARSDDGTIIGGSVQIAVQNPAYR